MYYVYGYYDPMTKLPFYIGKGTDDRLYFHLYETKENTINKRKYNKIESIRKQGQTPIIKILKKFDNENDAYEFEEELIQTYGRKGYDTDGILTNITLGNSPPNRKGAKLTEEQCKLKRGRKLSHEHIEKLKNKIPWNKGIKTGPRRDDVKKKISDKNKGRIVTEEHKQKIREANLGKTKSVETRQKMSKNMKGRVPWNKGKSNLKQFRNYGNRCVFISPDGEEFTFTSQAAGCRELGLHTSKMSEVINGKLEHYHGWKARRDEA